jgi:hypothetical protein
MGGLILAVGGRSPLTELLSEVRCTRVCESVLSLGAIEGGTIVEAIDMVLMLSLVDETMLVVLVCEPGGPYPAGYPGFGDGWLPM